MLIRVYFVFPFTIKKTHKKNQKQEFRKKQVSVISNIFKSKKVLYFKQVLVTRKKSLNRKNKKQEKTAFKTSLPLLAMNLNIFSSQAAKDTPEDTPVSDVAIESE